MKASFSRVKLIFTMLTVFAFSSFAGGDSLAEKVDKLFSEWDKLASPGCALGIIKDGHLVYARGYGLANLEYNIPLSSKSVFRIGSTSKQFTAMCMILLEEKGKISLDDNIRKYLPEIREYESPITIRHLLHHTSGLRDYLELMYLAGMRDDDFLTDGEVLDLIARQKELNFKPGDEYLYSNSGYFLLSVIVKRASGQSLRKFAEENIFKPLGMKVTHFHDDHTMFVKNRAAGYSPQKKDGFRINMTTLDVVGDGGIFTTVEDLCVWDQNFYHNKLGKGGQDLIKKMLTPATLNNGERLDYACGLVVSEYRGLKMVSHGGAFVGFRAEMIRFPEQKFSVICLANLSSIAPTKLALQVADIYLSGQFKKGKEKAVVSGAKFIELPEKELKSKTGTFKNLKTGSIAEISIQEGKLMVNASGYTFQISPVSSTRFRAVEAPVDIELEFERKEKDKPQVMRAYMESQKPETYEAIEVISPSPAQLAEYRGKYYSEELLAGYKIVFEEEKLFLRHENRYKNYPQTPLKPTVKDEFHVEGININFIRDNKGKISAFLMESGRVKHIRFEKKS